MRPKIALQYLLPHRLLSRVVYRATRWTWRPWKNFLIRRIVAGYDVDMSQAADANPLSFAHFNAFFTRALKAGARPLDPDPLSLVSPADGRISQAGIIEDGAIFQAKGRRYTVAELLAGDDAAVPYRHGRFITIYLSPRDYHRVHMPLDGDLLSTRHVPGRLFSVAPFAVDGIPRLFARNERLVCHFQGEHGPFAVILVGAMLVSSISTVWDGLVIPPYAKGIVDRDARTRDIHLRRGEELGRFNMGSTVIVLVPDGRMELEPGLTAHMPVQMGQRLGQQYRANP